MRGGPNRQLGLAGGPVSAPCPDLPAEPALGRLADYLGVGGTYVQVSRTGTDRLSYASGMARSCCDVAVCLLLIAFTG